MIRSNLMFRHMMNGVFNEKESISWYVKLTQGPPRICGRGPCPINHIFVTK